jgi:hypothetical protein
MPTEQAPLGMTTQRGGFVLTAVIALAVLAIGAVLWSDQGAAVFTALVSAAIAWCF